MRHILIVGRNGVGKSTLIRALLEVIPAPDFGVITKKEPPQSDGFCPVYIHRFGAPKQFSAENRIGLCREGKSIAFPEVFDRFAETAFVRSDGIVVFDELGFLESEANRFTAFVLDTLDRAEFVIAAVRDKETPFLNAIRSHPRADVYRIDEINREALKEKLLLKLQREFAD